MMLGPGTHRPNLLLDEIIDHLRSRELSRALITTSDGRLVGLLFLEDAERAARAEEEVEECHDEDRIRAIE